MASQKIQRSYGYSGESYVYYPVAIIGAGESGIAMGCRLKDKLGFDQFRIFERHAGIGGTWWINRYPGVACDVPALFYSFSFAPNPAWTSLHPAGPEMIRYFEDVCTKYGLNEKIQVNTEVSEARWLKDEEQWEITLMYLRPGMGDASEAQRREAIEKHGRDYVYLGIEKARAKVLVSAVGGLVEPKEWPKAIPGEETFAGDIFHSARWNREADLNDRDVVVVGTGCSAAQLVPVLRQPPYNARSVTQVMRSPPWVMPDVDLPVTRENWEKWSPKVFASVPGLARFFRTLLFLRLEYDWRLFGNSEFSARERTKLEKQALELMQQKVPEKYHEILTPSYPIGCKRRILDSDWFESLRDPKVDLTTQPLTAVQERSVILGPGRTYPDPQRESAAPTAEREVPADVIILANGFETSEWLHALPVIGREGRSLHEVWRERGGAQAYLGNAMDGFPNFFIIFGPNTVTGHSSVILATECMVEYSLKHIKLLLDGTASQVEVKQEAEVAYTAEIQEQLRQTVFANSGCRSWYKEDSGWNSTTYPYSQFRFIWKCTFPKWSDWNIKYTKKGRRRQLIRQGLTIIALSLAVLGALRVQRQGYRLKDVPDTARTVLNGAATYVTRSADRAAQLAGNWSSQ